MRRKESIAWTDLGYMGPSLPELNREAAQARVDDRAEARSKRQAREKVPVRRVDGKAWLRLAHDAANGLIACTPGGKVTPLESGAADGGVV